VVTDIGQCSLDSIIAPRRILSGKPQNGIYDDLTDSGPASSLSLIGVVPLIRHEITVPAEDRVGSHNGGQLQQCLAAESMAFHSQYASLIISQKHTLFAEFRQQRFDLVVLELDDPLLTFAGPANEDGKQNVAGLEHELHGKLGPGQEKRPASVSSRVNSSG
jgi:hypothetical protein